MSRIFLDKLFIFLFSFLYMTHAICIWVSIVLKGACKYGYFCIRIEDNLHCVVRLLPVTNGQGERHTECQIVRHVTVDVNKVFEIGNIVHKELKL